MFWLVDFNGGDAGITLWRELSDFPFYTMIDKDTKYSTKVNSLLFSDWNKSLDLSFYGQICSVFGI